MADALERLDDPKGLSDAGDWIVGTHSGEELVTRVTRVANVPGTARKPGF